MTSRILAGTSADLQVTVYSDGDAVDFDAAPAPTVALYNAESGAVILAETSTGVTEVAGGILRYTLSQAQTATPVPIRAVWTASINGVESSWTTYHEVVGDFLFTIAELRAIENAALATEADYPDTTIIEERDRVTEAFEQILGFALGSRYRRAVLNGDDGPVLWLDGMECDSLLTISTREHGTQTWTAFTADELADTLLDRNGRLIRESLGSWPAGRRNVRVEYLEGVQPIPGELRAAGMRLAYDWLVASDLPRNAIAQSDQLGTFTLATPGLRGAYFGIPRVDEVLHRLTRRRIGVG